LSQLVFVLISNQISGDFDVFRYYEKKQFVYDRFDQYEIVNIHFR